MMFDSRLLFEPFLFEHVPESDDRLGDMVRLKTIAMGPSCKQQAIKILDFFSIDSGFLISDAAHERFWEIIYDIKMRVFSQLTFGPHEYRVDWSKKDRAFCLWYRPRDIKEDATRDLVFVRKSTVNNILHTEVRESGVHGFGLFSTIYFEPGTLLGILDGQLMTREAYEYRMKLLQASLGNLQNHFFMEWNVLGSGKLLLVRSLRTKYSYINHSDNPNVELSDTSDHTINLIANKPIQVGQELFLDYRQESLPRSYFLSNNGNYLKSIHIDPGADTC